MQKQVDYIVHECAPSESLKQDDAKLLLNSIRKYQEEGVLSGIKCFAVYIKDAANILDGAFPFLGRSSSVLEQIGVQFAIIANEKICEKIRKHGLDRLILTYSDMSQFLKVHGNESKNHSLEFLNTMLDSVVLTMKVLLQAEIKAGKTRVISDSAQMEDVQVGAMAGILSSHFNGNMVIGFTEENFKKSMTQFLLMEVKELTGEILDGAAELLNVIIGQTKIKLNEKGFEIKQVIPSVITGEKIKINPVASHKAILIDYESSAGNFFILLSTNKSHL